MIQRHCPEALADNQPGFHHRLETRRVVVFSSTGNSAPKPQSRQGSPAQTPIALIKRNGR